MGVCNLNRNSLKMQRALHFCRISKKLGWIIDLFYDHKIGKRRFLALKTAFSNKAFNDY